MQIVPLQPVPSQSLIVDLNGQNTQFNVYQKSTGLFLDLYVANSPILLGVLGRNLRLMVINAYLGFVGDVVWLDNQGASDPTYTGLGGRYSLVYLLPAEIPASYLNLI